MRKYIVGALFGLLLGLSATTYADELQSLIGKKVQGQTDVYLDGTKLDSAIIVDGKSYSPTRKISESAGKKVSFVEGGIYLETINPTTETEPVIKDDTTAPSPEPTEETYSMEVIDNKIKILNLQKDSCNGQIEFYSKSSPSINEEDRLKSLEILKSKLAEIQAELDLWLSRKSALEGK